MSSLTGRDLGPLVPLLAGIGLLLPLSAAATDDAQWKIENIRQAIELGDVRLLDLENPHGELHVRGSGDATDTEGAIDLYATVQHHVDDPDRPQVEHRIEGDRLVLSVAYPPLEQPLPPSWAKRRIDLVLYVSPEYALELESEHEKLRVKGFGGDVHARSVTGPISIITAGQVDARSDYGELDVRLTAGSSLDAKLETLTGEITLTLPPDAKPLAHLESRGLFTSDFSIDIEWTTASRKRGLVGLISEQKPTLHLSSERGDLKLLRRPAPLVAKDP